MLSAPTYSLLGMIKQACKEAKCQVIDGKRCFVTDQETYGTIMEYLFTANKELSFDSRIAEEGYENFELSISARDKARYFLCTPAEPTLDKLWEKKAP